MSSSAGQLARAGSTVTSSLMAVSRATVSWLRCTTRSASDWLTSSRQGGIAALLPQCPRENMNPHAAPVASTATTTVAAFTMRAELPM